MKHPPPSSRFTLAGAVALIILPALVLYFSNGGGAQASGGPARAPGAAASPTPKDFDLVEQTFDPDAPKYDANQLLLNPQWGWQANNRFDPSDPFRHFPDPMDTERCPDKAFRGCTSTETDIDQAGFCTLLICGWCPPSQIGFCPPAGTRVRGHVNWVAATYTGVNCWNNISWPDMDYTMNFIPDGRAGLTLRNHPNQNVRAAGGGAATPKVPLAFHIEFDSRATVEGFNTPRWTELRDAVGPCKTDRNCDRNPARRILDGRRAVVLGLVGLDSEHTGYSELHPVYVIAVEVKSDPEDNVWLVFARNRGTQGFCSQEDHPLPLSELRLLIPKPPGAEVGGVELAAGTQFSTNLEGSCPTGADFRHFRAEDLKQTEGVLVSFRLPTRLDLPEPFVGPLVEGEVHLKWLPRSPDKPVQGFTPVPERCEPLKKISEEEEFTEQEPSPEEKLAILRGAEQELARKLKARAASTVWTKCAVPPGPVASGGDARASAAMRANRPRLTRMEGTNAPGFAVFRQAVVNAVCKGRDGKSKCR